MAFDPVSAISEGVGKLSDLAKDVIDRVIPDKDAAAKAKAEIDKLNLDATLQVTMKGGDIVMAEARGESWLQRNWRPLTMLTFTFMVFNNYVLYPYLHTYGVVSLQFPTDFWDLLKYGIGGYIGLRSAEKITTTVTGNGVSSNLKDVWSKIKGTAK